MSDLLTQLAERSFFHPDDIALEGADSKLTASELKLAVQSFANALRDAGVRRLGLLADNGPAWIITDLACQDADICLIPLPHFFSDAQLSNSIEGAGIDAFLTDNLQRLSQIAPSHTIPFECGDKYGMTLNAIRHSRRQRLPDGTKKITFTSGSTGAPRGVCLTIEQQIRVAQALIAATQVTAPRHLCLLPLSTLLENIGGVYAPLLAGGTVIALPSADVGLNGSASLDIPTLLAVLERHQPTSIILLPQLLIALTAAIDAGWIPPASLKFVAVGGGKVSANIIHQARNGGLPVYEGYGLSETASVACLNRPACDLPGSVGQPLGHINVAIKNGEIIVRGNTFLGYLRDESSWYPEFVETGDMGYRDNKGFIHISGRKKNILISSFGRNINPEWIESCLLSNSSIDSCVVLGDAKPYCTALISADSENLTDQDIQTWINRVNADLPDYARVIAWHRLHKPLSARDGFLTENGRPCRAQIEQQFHSAIESLYPRSQRVN
jgi:long-chain acyl-CoA synthetase